MVVEENPDATGLEPATSGVTGCERRDDERIRPTTRGGGKPHGKTVSGASVVKGLIVAQA